MNEFMYMDALLVPDLQLARGQIIYLKVCKQNRAEAWAPAHEHSGWTTDPEWVMGNWRNTRAEKGY